MQKVTTLCDRCGSKLTPEDIKYENTSVGFWITDIDEDSVDLCKNCYISFYDWMKAVDHPAGSPLPS